MSNDTEAAEFLRLVRGGDLGALRSALAAKPELVNALGPHPTWGGRVQPLHVAVETRQWPVFELLLEAGADVNGSNEEYEHWSPLMLAANGDVAMAKELRRHGAHMGVAEALLCGIDALLPERLPELVPGGGSWLGFARTPQAIDHLLALGAPAELPNRWGATPMNELSQRGWLLAGRLMNHGVKASPEDLARLGAPLEAVPVTDSVMLAAVGARQQELVARLLSLGGNANARAVDRSRQTALHEAAWNGDLAMAQLLVAAGADLAALDEEHSATPLEWAETALEVVKRAECRPVAEWLRLKARAISAASL